jgi:hypothetical protein
MKRCNDRYDGGRPNDAFYAPGSFTVGPVFRNDKFNIRLDSLPPGDFGAVDLDTVPYEITLNADGSPGRIRVSLVHEILHVLDEQYKLGLSHDGLHVLACAIERDVLPPLVALYARQVQQQ